MAKSKNSGRSLQERAAATGAEHKSSGPSPLGDVLSRLMTLRGYGRTQGNRQLAELWRRIAGDMIADRTKVLGLKNGVLQVGVANAALLSELTAFHRHSLLQTLRTEAAHTGIRDLKFRLRGRSQ
jgi:predicted nucleic acid-binding Zn ribbon protein